MCDDNALNRRFALIALVFYVAVIGVVAAHHEPWRDEADSWLLTRDAGLHEIATRARYGGFPILWYLLVAPLAKSGLPYASQNVLNAAFAVAAAALLLFFAPFRRTTKLLLLFSYYFAYEYAVIARPYALSIALLFAVAALHPRRHERPIAYALLIALAMNVNAQAFIIATVLGVLFMIERRELKTAAVLAAAVIAVYFQVRTPPDGQRIVGLHAINSIPDAIGGAFLPGVPFGAIAGAIVLVAIGFALRRDTKALFVLVGSVAGLLIVFVFVWFGGYRHAGFLLVAVIVAMWISNQQLRVAQTFLSVLLALSCLISMRYWVDEIALPFSGAREMALYIRANGIDRDPIAAHNLTQCEALLPYLDHTRFWYAGLHDWGTYLTWDRNFERALDVPYPIAVLLAKTYFRGQRWHLLLNVEMPDPARNGFRLVYRNREQVFEKRDERYWLYAPIP
jgi:hypothetical protein